ncbi:large conductance mechanosensitive channel protein MscL [Sphingobacteriaceae bacterium]|nr:large conductance mechanosensitive channel protein MscL [Sphingobacteriaceae bacterium]
MGVIKEFKEFVLRGNVVDLAIGVIIGGAFNKIVSSLIEDVITPLMLKPVLEAAHVATLQEYAWHGAKIGLFISSVITFILTAFVLFLIIKAMNAAKKKEEAMPAAVAEIPNQEKLLMEIRDALKK